MKNNLVLGCMLLLLSSVACAQPLAVANGGLTGQWFDPQRSGEGYFVEIVEVDGVPTIAVAWFTYDSAGNQMWLVGSAPIPTGATAVEVPVFVTQGPVFGPDFDPDDLQLISWGTLSFRFDNCNRGTVGYDSVLGFGSGSVDVVRLTSILDFECEVPPPPANVFPGIWRVADTPTVCFNISSNGERLTRVGSGCGRTAPLGHALNLEDSFVFDGKQCSVDFSWDRDVVIQGNKFAITPEGSSFPLIQGEFFDRTSAQLIYDDRVGCQNTYFLTPIR